MRFQFQSLRGSLFKSLFIASVLAIASGTTLARANSLISQATATARVEQREQQIRQIRPENYDLTRHPVTDANERHWKNILWTTAIVEPQEPYVAQAIAQILSLASQPTLTKPQQDTIEMAMQVGTQLYLSNPHLYTPVGQQFLTAIDRSSNPEWTAMALSALLKAGLPPNQAQQLSDRIRQRFPNWNNNVHLYSTLQDVAYLSSPSALPPLKDLLDWTVAPNQLQMYVFCRPDRSVLCRAVLKNRQGTFMQQNGQLWTVPLLLRSLHGVDWNFTRGQTPQGLYRIEGTRAANAATFRAYGAFSLVKLFVPYEAGVQEFVPGQRSWTGGLAAYQNLLPSSWRNYYPIQQSYWAGKAGRSAFRIHGSGEATNFFTNNSRNPASAAWNPTIGCLSALELYDDAGRLQQADMPNILSQLSAIGGQRFTGYLFVVDLPATSNQPVSLEEIQQAVSDR